MNPKITKTAYGPHMLTRYTGKSFVSELYNNKIRLFRKIKRIAEPNNANMQNAHADALKEFYTTYKTAPLDKKKKLA